MIQIAKQFDPVTLGKIKRSALIALGGFIVTALPMLLPDILKMLQGHPMASAFIGAAGTWIVNTINEWRKGQPQP